MASSIQFSVCFLYIPLVPFLHVSYSLLLALLILLVTYMFNSSSLRLFSLLFCNNLAFYTICYYFSSVIYKNTCPRCSSRQFPYFISHRLPRLSLLNICSNTPVFTYHPIYINLLESRSDHVSLVTCLFLLFLTSYLFIEILKLPVLAAAPDIKHPFSRIFPANTPILPKNPRQLG